MRLPPGDSLFGSFVDGEIGAGPQYQVRFTCPEATGLSVLSHSLWNAGLANSG
jgi:hypothetical protein